MKKLLATLLTTALLGLPAVAIAQDSLPVQNDKRVLTADVRGDWDNLDPFWWILIGMLLGGGLVFTLEKLSQNHWKKHKTK